MEKSKQKIRVAVLDDHQGILDGYQFRLEEASDIEIIALINYGEILENILSANSVDVLILDVQVPISPTNHNPYPILYQIPKILQTFPLLKILVISMHTEQTLIQAAMNAGAKGFILKDDNLVIKNLASVVRVIHSGGVFLSEYAFQQVLKDREAMVSHLLTSRQIEALSLYSAYPDANSEEIAQKMNIAHSTFRNLLSEAYLRLDVSNRAAAIEKARQLGLITQILSDTRPLNMSGKALIE